MDARNNAVIQALWPAIVLAVLLALQLAGEAYFWLLDQ